MNAKIALVLLGYLAAAELAADTDAEEYRLLKSWGMQFDAKGMLRIRPGLVSEVPQAEPWQPDMSMYKAQPQSGDDQALEPLVISSKHKPAKK